MSEFLSAKTCIICGARVPRKRLPAKTCCFVCREAARNGHTYEQQFEIEARESSQIEVEDFRRKNLRSNWREDAIPQWL
jgi:hypothetical protein